MTSEKMGKLAPCIWDCVQLCTFSPSSVCLLQCRYQHSAALSAGLRKVLPIASSLFPCVVSTLAFLLVVMLSSALVLSTSYCRTSLYSYSTKLGMGVPAFLMVVSVWCTMEPFPSFVLINLYKFWTYSFWMNFSSSLSFSLFGRRRTLCRLALTTRLP